MKLKLIAPARKPEWGESFWDLKGLCKLTGRKAGGVLLALPTLAALTPSDVEVAITDENVEQIDFDEKVDLVGISFLTSLAPRAYEIADEFRARGVSVVLGGIHASMLPEEAIKHADSVVIGEAEDIWSQVINDCREDKMQKLYRASCFPDLKNSPIPRWDLLKADAYCYFTVQTGRGCPNNCNFCSVTAFNGHKYRHKPIENVVKEIELLQQINPRQLIFIADDNLLAIPSCAEQLLQGLLPLRLKSWWCQSSVNRLKDDSLLDLMYKAGCRAVFVGFESLSQKSLDSMNKSKVNRVEEYKEVVEKVHSHGIAVLGSFILGSDDDDETVFDMTATFINKAGIAFSMVNILTPFPGTTLREKLAVEHRLLDIDWSRYDVEHVCFRPVGLTASELQEGCHFVLRKINAYDALLCKFQDLWDKGVFLRTSGTPRLSRGRLLFSLASLFSGDIKRTSFALRGLWNHNNNSISSVSLALSFHDYAYLGCKSKDKKG